MRFRPVAFGGEVGGSGVVDYRLVRRGVVSDYHAGRLSLTEVCDAQPELRRAAANCADTTQEPCPICEDAALVHVCYVFGPHLPRSGRCVTSLRELDRLAARSRRIGDFVCYVVEVCPDCHWNHLVRVYPLGRPVEEGS